MADKAKYAGNSQHKSRPGDYGLAPATSPRPGKTLCDADGEFPAARAEELLRDGIRRGMVSIQERSDWPQNVWAVSGDVVFEGQLENRSQGVYHGYPVPIDDDFRKLILKEWTRRER